MELDWVRLVNITVSSYFDLTVVTKDETGLIFNPKFVQSKADLGSQNMTHFIPFERLNSPRGIITSVAILPVISTKRSDCGQPESTIIAIGTEQGYLLFYMPNGTLLVEQIFHKSAVKVRRISYAIRVAQRIK